MGVEEYLAIISSGIASIPKINALWFLETSIYCISLATAIYALIRLRTIKKIAVNIQSAMTGMRENLGNLDNLNDVIDKVQKTNDGLRDTNTMVSELDTIIHQLNERISDLSGKVSMVQSEISSDRLDAPRDEALAATNNPIIGPSRWDWLVEFRKRNVQRLENIIQQRTDDDFYGRASRQSYTKIIERLEYNDKVISPEAANHSRDLFMLHSSNRRNKIVSDSDIEKAVELDKILDQELMKYDGVSEQDKPGPKVILSEKSKNSSAQEKTFAITSLLK